MLKGFVYILIMRIKVRLKSIFRDNSFNYFAVNHYFIIFALKSRLFLSQLFFAGDEAGFFVSSRVQRTVLLHFSLVLIAHNGPRVAAGRGIP